MAEGDVEIVSRAALEGQPLVKMHRATIKSCDGLDLIVHYTLPLSNNGNHASTGFGKAFTNAGDLELFTTRVGDFRTEDVRALRKKHSPLTCVDRICRPVLIGQGAKDARVKQAESDQLVAVMQARNIPVTYALYPGLRG